MGKLGKMILVAGIMGAVAAGTYRYMEKLEEDALLNGEEPNPAITSFNDTASRAYTTIKDSADKAYGKVKEKIGPKGEEVLSVVGETANTVKDTVVSSATRVKDIIAEDRNIENDDNVFDEFRNAAEAKISEVKDNFNEITEEDIVANSEKVEDFFEKDEDGNY